MERFWTWGGRYVGVRQKEYLVSCDGRILGRFWGKEIYNQDGEYIGETGRGGRLLRRCSKTGCRRPMFSHSVRGTITNPLCDCAPYPVLSGFEDFRV